MPIYIIRNDTVKICTEGAITAANGTSSIFLINSVLAVSRTGGLHQEEGRSSYSGRGRNDSNDLFAQLLKQSLEEYNKV